MNMRINRRQALACGLGAAGWCATRQTMGQTTSAVGSPRDRSAEAPTAPVSIVRCASYERMVFRTALEESFKLIGGLKPLVENKTVTVKLNLTGTTWAPVFGLPAQETYQSHPVSVAALCALLAEAGAKSIVLVENLYWDRPFEDVLRDNGWNVGEIVSAGHHRVTFEDTRNRGRQPGYSRLKVPWGGYIFPSFDFHPAYDKTDLLVSLAKLKQHATAGITGAVKNCFGNTPTALYGDTSPDPRGLFHRAGMFHGGKKAPPAGVPGELAHGQPRKATVRVPRIVADIFGARPAELNLVEGVRTISGGEGHWNKGIALLEPKLLIAGVNGVTTDSVATAVMGFDPAADHGRFPFQGDNHLKLLAAAGVGTNDLGRIEVRGLPLRQAVHPFQKAAG